MLLVEMLERAFELKLLRKEYDSISNDGKFMRTETVVNTYSNGKTRGIKNQSTHVQVKNLDEKVLQESITNIDYKTDKYGNITQQSISADSGVGLEETVSITKYNNSYGKDGQLQCSYAQNQVYSAEAQSEIECLSRTGYTYDEIGKLKVIICDRIPTNGNTFQVGDVAFLQVYLLEYNDEGMLSSINLMDVDKQNNNYKCCRFVINYDPKGYIESIHRIDTDAKDDEYFQYNDDDTVTVVKNECDDDGIVIAKSTLTFSRC